MALAFFFRSQFGLVGASVRRCAGRTFRARRGSCVSFSVPSSACVPFSRSQFGFSRSKRAPVRICASVLPEKAGGYRSRVRKKSRLPDKNKCEHPLPQQPQKGGASFRARSPPTKSRNPTKQMRISAFPNNPKKGGTSFRARSPRKSNNPTKQCERQIDFYCFFAENELL
ncbi:hypothetical protein TresaDRAFT_0774 [Treponema saccharophilum DSM 2985]|uniref:Uncharacterized protein n=1 Tax=Treponema saccharophilum DSM 2985 TaxID=907348 RepID=H7ENM1_9SPIR|nr:hypothetical protein TresaDRAFT_0774 [Treponema saccharophilum DSM 2985]